MPIDWFEEPFSVQDSLKNGNSNDSEFLLYQLNKISEVLAVFAACQILVVAMRVRIVTENVERVLHIDAPLIRINSTPL